MADVRWLIANRYFHIGTVIDATSRDYLQLVFTSHKIGHMNHRFTVRLFLLNMT